MGYSRTANEVLYAAQKRKMRELKKSCDWLKWLGLLLLKYTIGFGYGLRYFRSLVWVIALVALGYGILVLWPDADLKNTWEKIFFSLERIFPIIQLDRRFDGVKLAPWQYCWFYVFKILGSVLGAFIVAGLSGITRKI